MRTSIPVIIALALAFTPAGPAVAQIGLPTPKVELGTRKFELPAGETTETQGKIPVDLVGYWLVAEEHVLPDRGKEKRFYPSLQLYRIDRSSSGALEVHWFAYQPPEAVQAKLKKAQAEQATWTPTAADVAEIAKDVAAHPPVVDTTLRGAHKLTAAAELDAETKKSPAGADAKFAIRSLFQPERRPAFGQSYFVKKIDKDELDGWLTMGAVPSNAKGVPLPIGTKGTFRWIRLALPASPSPTAAAPAATPAP